MSQIPADLDQTMWDIAERNDQKAAGDFSEKFPNLAASMTARMGMVAGMKEMRNSLAPSFVPAFKPKFMYKPKPMWVRYGPMALGLAALASASLYITWNLATPLPTPDMVGPNTSLNAKPVQQAPEVSLPPTPAAPNTESPQPFGKDVTDDVADQHVTMANVKLQDAILAVAKQGHLSVEGLPPNFPNPKIKVDLTGKPGLDLLQQLGEQEGFKVIDDGAGQVIIIPGTDSNSAKAGDKSKAAANPAK